MNARATRSWVILALIFIATLFAAASTHATVPDSWQRGISFTAWWKDLYLTPGSDQSLELLASTGANWISLLVTCYQRTVSSTRIDCLTKSRTPTDASLIHAIQKAKSVGLKIMLKPHVDLSNDESHWRGQINWGRNKRAWARWFSSYRKFILHYARLAQASGVDQFSVGTELEGTTQRESEWRQVISAVRTVYSGPLTYASNHEGEEVSIQFWDALDRIGVDAYVSLSDKTNPTLDELKAGWGDYLSTLRALSQRWSKPIIFTELGYRSMDGANMAPWDWQAEGSVDLQEQADCYRAFFESFQSQPWMYGVFWWNWDPDSNQGGSADTGYTPHKKPAEAVLRSFYGGSATSAHASSLRGMPLRARDSIRFAVESPEGKEFQLKVFALNGRVVYTSGWQSKSWIWNLFDALGQRVARGVYLYVFTTRSQDGRMMAIKLQKLLVQ